MRVHRRASVIGMCLAVLSTVLMTSATPALADSEQIDQQYSGSEVRGQRCSWNIDPAYPDSLGHGVAFPITPVHHGAIPRFETDIGLFVAPDWTVPSHSSADVLFTVMYAYDGMPGGGEYTSASVSAANVLAAPEGQVPGYHHVIVTFPRPLAVSHDWKLMLWISVANTPVRTEYCLPEVANSPGVAFAEGVTYHGQFAGSYPAANVGTVPLFTDYISFIGTQLVAEPYVRPDRMSPGGVAHQYRARLSAADKPRPYETYTTGFSGESITFLVDSRIMCTAVTDGGGTATCPANTKAPGPAGYTVRFAGDTFLGRTSGHGDFATTDGTGAV